MGKEKTQLEIIMERQDKFGRSCDPNYRTIKEQEEDEEDENGGDNLIRSLGGVNKMNSNKQYLGIGKLKNVDPERLGEELKR